MPFCPQPKIQKSVRLRTKQTAKAKQAKDLSALYRQVYQRDGYRCVACSRHVDPGALNELLRAHPHHVIFRSQATKAEKHTSANVTTLCVHCHAAVHEGRLSITGNSDTKLKITREAR